MAIDLHTHTTASDGSLTPSQLVHLAREKGLRALAVTDHDTIDGNAEALRAGEWEGLTVVPGIEISVDHSPGSMHMLGYFIDTESSRLREKLTLLQESRSDRNPKIIEKLNELGLEVSYDEVLEVSGGGQVGRPHIAQVLLRRGYIKTIQEAFDRYLGKGAPAYFDKFRLTAGDAIAMILDAGGVPVLAHPFTLKCGSSEELDRLVRGLTGKGLQGVEVYYTEHSARDVSRFRRLAERYGLLLTGGSDFHGANMSGVDLGKGRGKLSVPYRLYENLRKHWEEKRDGYAEPV